MIKVEHPMRGDDTRAWGPPYAKYKPDSDLDGPGESAYFLGVCKPHVHSSTVFLRLKTIHRPIAIKNLSACLFSTKRV